MLWCIVQHGGACVAVKGVAPLSLDPDAPALPPKEKKSMNGSLKTAETPQPPTVPPRKRNKGNTVSMLQATLYNNVYINVPSQCSLYYSLKNKFSLIHVIQCYVHVCAHSTYYHCRSPFSMVYRRHPKFM